MSQKLAKSPEMLRKEAEVKALRDQLKKKQTTLKSLKTRLQNFKADIEEVVRKAHSTMFRTMEAVESLRMEIAELARQLKKAKGMSRTDKEQLQMMADELAGAAMFGESFEQFKEYKQQRDSGNFDFDEFERAKMRNVFGEFEVKPPEKEQKDIRKVFVKLSQKFHPDLAKNEREAQEFHLLMQQINEAYQHNDIQALLELESLYLLDSLDFETKAVTVDSLQLEIERLKRDTQFIEQQIDRMSEEIKQLRQSDMGKMLTSVNKSEREGGGLDLATAQIDNMLQVFTQLRDGLKDSIKLGKMSPKLMDLLLGQDIEEEEDDDDINPFDMLMRLANGDEDAMDFFGSAFGAGDEDIEDPVFPVGSSVRVAQPAWSPFDKKTNMKGWQGRVERAYYNEDDGGETYTVSFDSQTIAQMPAKLIDRAVKDGDYFSDADFSENQLTPCQARDTEQEAVAAYRVRYHAVAWKSLPDKTRAARLQGILLEHPDKSDFENWTAYLQHQLSFPFEAKTRGRAGSKKGGIIKVFGIDACDEYYGHTMAAKADGKKTKHEHALTGLQAADKNSKEFQVLEDYFVWAAESL